MFTGKDDEKQRFTKNLFDFLHSRGSTNLKVPQIGGKELDLFELYQSVIKRGGAQKVSNTKLWKEIVVEFDLPPSCTSASFTLKNHYQKYLLAYEQKFHFGRKEDEMVKELGNVRQRRHNNNSSIEHRPEVMRDRPIQHDTNLKQNLVNHYEERRKTNDIHLTFIKKSAQSPFVADLKRIQLAFESKLQEEVRFALNSLLLNSCATNTIFCIETHSQVFEEMIEYLKYLISLSPEIFCRLVEPALPSDSASSFNQTDPLTNTVNKDRHKTQNGASVLEKQWQFTSNRSDLGDLPGEESILEENLIHPRPKTESLMADIADLMHIYPNGTIDKLRQDKAMLVTMKYEDITKSEVLEQMKIIFQTLRNLSFIPQNEIHLFKNKAVSNLILECFFTCVDGEINRSILDIVSVLCKHFLISSIPSQNSKLFCAKLVKYLDSEAHEEQESALECFHNLMLSQENEIVIERMLPEIVDSIVKLLFISNGDPVESSLEILCYLSDLKGSTRAFLAQKNNLIPRLLALIAGNSSKMTEKIAKLSALILSNLCEGPSAQSYFVPYEKDIFCLASIDESVSDTLSGILLSLESVSNNLYQVSTDFYSKKLREQYGNQTDRTNKAETRMFNCSGHSNYHDSRVNSRKSHKQEHEEEEVGTLGKRVRQGLSSSHLTGAVTGNIFGKTNGVTGLNGYGSKH